MSQRHERRCCIIRSVPDYWINKLGELLENCVYAVTYTSKSLVIIFTLCINMKINGVTDSILWQAKCIWIINVIVKS